MHLNLHTRSWFSFLRGGSSPENLARRAAELGMTTLALTDRHGVYGAVRFERACRAAGVRPVIGAEVVVGEHPLVLLAQSANGYANLCRILSAAHATSREEPSTTIETLATYADDIICLTGGREGYMRLLLEQRRRADADAWLSSLHSVFGDRLFIELTHDYRPGGRSMLNRLREWSSRTGIPSVATAEARYARFEDASRHDLLACIRLGSAIYESHPDRLFNAEMHLKGQSEMRRLIPFPDAWENATAIAASCHVDLIAHEVTPPAADLPDGLSPRDRLHDLCHAALVKRYTAPGIPRARDQLAKELAVIGQLDLEDYFLVVREVVEEARRRGIRCAGRGSAANSIVAYLLGITGVDPIANHLLFERFLHGGRKGTPDIDIDFDTERRDEVIAWMGERFGHEQTAMTATVITYGLRMAVRDVAKALGWPRETIDAMAEVLPHGRPSHVWKLREKLAAIVGESVMLDHLLAMVAGLEECPRHLGLHSGGMILSRVPLYHFSPVQRSANGVTEIQFDKEDAESLGLIKLDVLGLRMLAAVSEAVELVERSMGEVIDLDALPLDDPGTFRLIRDGDTIGVFQIESQGQMHLLARNQPETFADLIAEIALFRPGPLQGGMVNPYVRRRQGAEPVIYDHPDLEPILRDTYGVILFQEQVLEIAHVVAGMPLLEADRFGSLMSKFRSSEEMYGMADRFIAGTVSRGIPQQTAATIFAKLAHFVGYGFCRSHAAAFAATVYHSAWLKCHHPAAFMAAIMQHRPAMYNLTTLEQEARRHGVIVLRPDINQSEVRYALQRTESGALAIRKPLHTIRHLSAEECRAIAQERLRGPFTSVENLYERVEIARDGLDALARSGALDDLAGSSRRALWEVGLLANRLGPSGTKRAERLLDVPAIQEDDVPVFPALVGLERLSWDYQTHGAARRHPVRLIRRLLNDLTKGALIVSGTLQAIGAWRGLVIEEATVMEGMLGGYRGLPSAYGGTDVHVTEVENGAFIVSIDRPRVAPNMPEPPVAPATMIVR